MQFIKAHILSGVLILAVGCLSSGFFLGSSYQKMSVKGISVSVAPTPISTTTPTPSITPLPSLTPTPSIRYYRPAFTPTPSIQPTQAPQQQTTNTVDKNTLNDYAACKRECPVVTDAPVCTKSPDSSSEVCSPQSLRLDQACVDSCKNKYGLTF
jgi:hypothetical protein